jgi:hypothetical protein
LKEALAEAIELLLSETSDGEQTTVRLSALRLELAGTI